MRFVRIPVTRFFNSKKMELFEIRNIDGTDKALFHLDERDAVFHATEGHFEKYTVFFKIVSEYYNHAAVKGASDIDIALHY